ncbi:MAG TPA: ABC transporter permease [Candidatus Dormibacteraeota bacterium]|nr:ABC transporter permease [Candidatus Dormibacteraeota bacterium]
MSWFSRRNWEQDANDELRFHIEQQTAANIAAGMSPEEARRQATLQFGALEGVKENCREQRNGFWLETLIADARYALRVMRKNPGFAAIAILTLALGIGANTAIFSVVYAVLLKPLPYPAPNQLVVVFDAKPQEGVDFTGVSYMDFEDVRAQNSVFTELAGNQEHDLTVTGRGEPFVADTAVVTAGLFDVLQVAPLMGRTFVPDDGRPGAAPVAIISEKLWRSRFSADPHLVGSSINLDKRSFTVIGIMRTGFHSPILIRNQDIWVPTPDDPVFGGWMTRRSGHWLSVIGRLKPGVSIAQAQAEMDGISHRLAAEFPKDDAGWSIRVAPLQSTIVSDERPALLLLLGAVALVLLIACANIANLLLSRATSRAKEMSVRIALGAGRGRIVRQLLTESAALGLLGGVGGTLLAYLGVRVLGSLLPSDLAKMQDIRVDGWVLAFALSLSVAASFVFGLAPALFAAGSDVQKTLREGSGRAGAGGGRQNARTILAAAEIALAMVLLVGAGLLVRSFIAMTAVSPGFSSQHLVKAEVSLPQFEYSTGQRWTAFADDLLARIQAEPGMRDSAIGLPLPLVHPFVNLGFEIEGSPAPPSSQARTANYVAASPEYFRVMEIPLLQGREFTREDVASTPRVTIISEAMARIYFPNQNPIGKRLVFGFPPNGEAPREIIGVVGNVRDVELRQAPAAMMYVPFAQAPFWGTVVVVRTNLSVAAVAEAIQRDAHAIDKDLPVTDIGAIPQLVDATLAQPRFQTLLLGLFSGLALTLAAGGIYGVISYSVIQRTHEIGIRISLGAQRGQVLRLVMGQGAKLALAGIAIGAAAAFALTRLMRSLLFEVSPADPLTFAGIAVLLVAVALAACYIPARRAMRVDPMTALRYE